MNWIQALDNGILRWTQEHVLREGAAQGIAAFSALGNYGFLWIALAIGLMIFYKKNRNYGAAMLFCLIATAVVVNILLKPWVARIRPFDALQFVPLIPAPEDFSFPSGHTAAAFASARAAFLWNKKFGYGMLVLACLMGASRLLLGVHFFTDVAAGAAVAWCCSQATLWGLQKVHFFEPDGKGL